MSSTSPSRILRRRTLIACPEGGFSRIALDRIASWRTRESTETESRTIFGDRPARRRSAMNSSTPA